MPCGSCGGRKHAAAPPAANQTMAPQMSTQMSADNIVWVMLNDGNIGQHPIVGVITKTNYNPRAHGEKFKMILADARAMPHKYIIVDDPNAVPVMVTIADTPTMAEPPEPIKVAEFATWPKKAGRPKKVA